MGKVAGRYGGIYSSHVRGEGKELVQSIEEAITIGEKGGLPVEIFHLKAAYQPGWGTLIRQAGETIEAAREGAASMSRRTCTFTPRAARRYPLWSRRGRPKVAMRSSWSGSRTPRSVPG